MDLLEEVVHARTIGVTRSVTKAKRMDIARKARISEQIARELVKIQFFSLFKKVHL